MMHKLVAVILTYNEEIHIARAIDNVLNWADKIIVLDSHSQDKTVDIARQLGAEVIFRPFDDYKKQRQYAIDYCKNRTEWMLFLDADEYLLDELKIEIKKAISDKNINGYYIAFRFIFMKRWIKHGGYYPTYILRLFRPNSAIIDSPFNEHVTVSGRIAKLKNDFVDHNLNNLAFWTQKHNKYTDFEAMDLWRAKNGEKKSKHLRFWIQAERKKWIRENIWNHLPLFLKPCLYFFYRYVIRMGFLDGKEGLIYHSLQGGWRFFLVDAKYTEMKMREKNIS